jgi:hypothetical protein
VKYSLGLVLIGHMGGPFFALAEGQRPFIERLRSLT